MHAIFIKERGSAVKYVLGYDGHEKEKRYGSFDQEKFKEVEGLTKTIMLPQTYTAVPATGIK